MSTSAVQPSTQPFQETISKLHVRIWGDRDPRFFLIHGLGDGGFIWNHVAPTLSSQGSCVAIDLRGHGESPQDPTRAYTIGTHVSDVSEVLKALCQEPVIIVGHSLGAKIAICLAAMLRSQTLGVVLVDGGPQLSSEAAAYSRQQFVAQPWWYRTIDEYALHLQERFPLSSPILLRSVASNALRPLTTGGYQVKCDKELQNVPLQLDSEEHWALFRSIYCPVLVVRGAGSAMLPRSYASRMIRENTRCSLQPVPQSGHAVMLDNPSGFISVLTQFAATLGRV
jgi:pimeloyl-ACP methyl ester carboxylesterase